MAAACYANNIEMAAVSKIRVTDFEYANELD